MRTTPRSAGAMGRGERGPSRALAVLSTIALVSGCGLLTGAELLEIGPALGQAGDASPHDARGECSSACPAGEYLASACGDATDRICEACTPVEHCAGSVTCTSAIDQRCIECEKGFVRDEGASVTCRRPTTCADLKRHHVASLDGVYTIDPDGAGGGVDPFDVYCDMTTHGGGWTLIGKVGAGKWADLTTQQFVDRVANPIADVGGVVLLSGARPAARDIAYFRRDRTNAIYHASPYAGESVVRVDFDSPSIPADEGFYFQQRKVSDPAWDFWAAMRDARRWSTGPSTDTVVSNYGVDFVLTHDEARFDAELNVVEHDSGGDTSFVWWGSGELSTYTLADRSTLEVTFTGGLLCNGVNNSETLWFLIYKPSHPYFKNLPVDHKVSIWLR